MLFPSPSLYSTLLILPVTVLIRELVTDGEFEGKTLLITDFGLARQIVQSARNAAAKTPQQLLQPPDASERKSSFDATAAGPLLSKSSSGAPVGTYPWMSPEAIRTGHFSKASDVWRLISSFLFSSLFLLFTPLFSL